MIPFIKVAAFEKLFSWLNVFNIDLINDPTD